MAYKPKTTISSIKVTKMDKKGKPQIIETKGKRYIAEDKFPDPKKHQNISFIKSGIRILGYFLFLYNIEVAVGVLVLSEGIGIYEELV